MTERCYETAEFGALVDLPAGDPGLAHIENCARCRGLLAAYRSFVAGSPAHADPVREQVVADFLDQQLGVRESDQGPGEKGGTSEVRGSAAAPIIRPNRAWWRSRALAPGLAAAAVVLLVLAWHPLELTSPPGPSAITRGDSLHAGAPDLDLRSALTPQGALSLTWSALPAADRYEIVCYAATLTEVATRDAGSATRLTLAAEEWSGWRDAPQPLLWRVRAYIGGDLVATSAPAVITPTAER